MVWDPSGPRKNLFMTFTNIEGLRNGGSELSKSVLDQLPDPDAIERELQDATVEQHLLDLLLNVTRQLRNWREDETGKADNES